MKAICLICGKEFISRGGVIDIVPTRHRSARPSFRKWATPADGYTRSMKVWHKTKGSQSTRGSKFGAMNLRSTRHNDTPIEE